MTTQTTATPQESAAPRTRTPASPASGDLLDIYLRESGTFPVLRREDQDALLDRLVAVRNAWVAAFLETEPALREVHGDLQRAARGEIAPGSLIPGPPRLEPGRIGPPHHAARLLRLFDRFVRLHGPRPFRSMRRNRLLVRALVYVGFRPRALQRYRRAACASGQHVRRRVERAHEAFVEARRPLVEHNLRLVLKVARNYSPGPLPMSDLVQEGNFGLLRATESFSKRFGVRFSTYAYLWIRQCIIRALEDKSRTIRLPVNVSQKLRKLARDENGRAGDRSGGLLNNPSVSSPILSLNTTQGDGEDLIGRLSDYRSLAPHSHSAGDDLRSLVQRSLDLLPGRQRLVLRLRFGIATTRPHTLSEIGNYLGISAERVRQIQQEAFSTLREGPEGQALEELVLD